VESVCGMLMCMQNVNVCVECGEYGENLSSKKKVQNSFRTLPPSCCDSFSPLYNRYAVEFEDNGEQFPNIPAAMWWCVTCLSTVGYGDAVPKSWLGKILGGYICTFWVAVQGSKF